LRPGQMLVGSLACSCGRHLTWRCECGAVTYGPALAGALPSARWPGPRAPLGVRFAIAAGGATWAADVAVLSYLSGTLTPCVCVTPPRRSPKSRSLIDSPTWRPSGTRQRTATRHLLLSLQVVSTWHGGGVGSVATSGGQESAAERAGMAAPPAGAVPLGGRGAHPNRANPWRTSSQRWRPSFMPRGTATSRRTVSGTPAISRRGGSAACACTNGKGRCRVARSTDLHVRDAHAAPWRFRRQVTHSLRGVPESRPSGITAETGHSSRELWPSAPSGKCGGSVLIAATCGKPL
jgi:hypothetical protein